MPQRYEQIRELLNLGRARWKRLPIFLAKNGPDA
jgi:hypothetical protein